MLLTVLDLRIKVSMKRRGLDGASRTGLQSRMRCGLSLGGRRAGEQHRTLRCWRTTGQLGGIGRWQSPVERKCQVRLEREGKQNGNGGWEEGNKITPVGQSAGPRKLGRRRHGDVRRQGFLPLREFRIRPPKAGAQSSGGSARLGCHDQLQQASILHKWRTRLALLHLCNTHALHNVSGAAPAGTGIAAGQQMAAVAGSLASF